VPPPSGGASRCAPSPADTMTNAVSHLCGFPDATTAGVPADAALVNVPGQRTSGQGWSFSSENGLVVTKAHAVIKDLNIAGGIEVKANDVTIEDSVVTETGDWWGIGLYGTSNVTIAHCNISSPFATGVNRLQVAIKDIYGNATGTKIIDNNIWHSSTAIMLASGVIEGNYIHDYGYSDTEGNDDHLNGISVGGGDTLPLLIQDNTILNNYSQTDAIALFQDFGTEANKTINDNLLAGGAYTIYGGGPNGACTSYNGTSGCYGSSENVVITNNRFSPMYFPDVGTFGPVAAFDEVAPGNVWSGNVWDNTNRKLAAPDAY
jgi:hypothetical protein